ncbi:hypothetical protein N2152v2_002584 [Parachlorella kessleri]
MATKELLFAKSWTSNPKPKAVARVAVPAFLAGQAAGQKKAGAAVQSGRSKAAKREQQQEQQTDEKGKEQAASGAGSKRMKKPGFADALPGTERQPEDLAVLREAERRRWRRCAQCRHMIELGEGCRHMTCKCGYEFCYICGKPWTKVLGQRSRQGCTCDLFDTTAVQGEPERLDESPGRERDAVRQQNWLELLGVAPVFLAGRGEAASGVPEWVPGHIRPCYKTKLCMYYHGGRCRRGQRCWFAHGARELRRYSRSGSVPHGAA